MPGPKKRYHLEDPPVASRNFTYTPDPSLYVEPSDATNVRVAGNVVRPRANIERQAGASKSAKQRNAFREENPNVAKWNDIGSAVPFVPLMIMGAGAASEIPGAIAAANTIGNYVRGAGKLYPWLAKALPYAETALAADMAGHAINDISNGEFTPETAINLTGLTPAISGTYRYGQKLYNTHKGLIRRTNKAVNNFIDIMRGNASQRARRAAYRGNQELSDAITNYLRDEYTNVQKEIDDAQTLKNKAWDYVDHHRELDNATRHAPIAKVNEHAPVDFRRMSDENRVQFFKKHGNDEALATYWNPETQRFEETLVQNNGTFDPTQTVKTGNIPITDARTGQVQTFNLPENELQKGLSRTEVTYGTTDGTRSYNFVNNKTFTGQEVSPNMPSEYISAVQGNIDEITKNILPGSKVFGSSANVVRGNLYHDAHDIDVIMTMADAKKHPAFKSWGTVRPGTFGYEHPTAGHLDVNVIDEKGGKAVGTLAHELYSQLYPKEYAELAKAYSAKGKVFDTNVPLNKTAKDLLNAYDPVTKSITDAFASSKSKHAGRAYYMLNYGNTADVRKGFDTYMNYITGGNWTPNKIPLSEFSNPTKNSELIKKLGLSGINEEQFINNPERMKLLFDYASYDKTFLGRGVNDNVSKALTQWKYDGTATAGGVGLNTVVGGDSGYGNIYGILAPKGIPTFNQYNKADDFIDALGKLDWSETTLTPDQINIVESLSRKYNVPLEPYNNLSDVLRSTRNQEGKNYRDFFNELTKQFNVPYITNGEWAPRTYYASMADQASPDVIRQLIPRGLDRPQTAGYRAQNAPGVGYGYTSTTPSNLERIIGEAQKRNNKLALRLYQLDNGRGKLAKLATERVNRLYNKQADIITKRASERARLENLKVKHNTRIDKIRRKAQHREDIADLNKKLGLGVLGGAGILSGLALLFKNDNDDKSNKRDANGRKIKHELGGTTRFRLRNGGKIPPTKYLQVMEKVAQDNYKNWEYNNTDEALVSALNDPTYNYRAFYNSNPDAVNNSKTHWPDTYKTVYHPTFSNESEYSGKKSQFNPDGILGGNWYYKKSGRGYFPKVKETFVPSWQQMLGRYDRRRLRNR